MKITIVGGNGFVGKNIVNKLVSKNYEIVSIDIAKNHSNINNLKFVSADTTSQGEWQKEIADSDAVINLAGATIFKFWTKNYKNLIYDSRISTTRNIVNAIDEKKQNILISTSAAGYYGDRKNELLNEQSSSGNDFLSNVCKDWESEALKAQEKNSRTCIMRFGIVLGKQGGALAQMLPYARFMLNPVLGSGQNFFPWIHIEDLVNACIFLLENPENNGIYNFTAPEFVTQKEFTNILGKILNRPAFLKVPESALKIFAGEFGKSLLMSQKADPQKLINCGFKFEFDNLYKAFENLL
ncbi:MAG: TIGR01777 family oxidoreductase [Desulforegulaceae bacterium]|nr:TIGR01777 family oxidoreductase [Desulforegulaceae bacterium]